MFTHPFPQVSLFSVVWRSTRNPANPHHARNRLRQSLSLVALLMLACLLVVRSPGQAHAATLTNPGNPAIQYADSHWNCADAACTSTVSAGSAQPNFECAEFVARSLAAEGLVPGLSPSSSPSAYGSYTALNGLTYDLKLITPTSGLRTLYNYLIDTGLGTDVGDHLNQAAPGDVVVYYDGSGTAHHTTLLVQVDAATPSNSLIDAHNNAEYHYSFTSEKGADTLTIVHLHLVHPAHLVDLDSDGYPDLIGKDPSGNLYAYPATRQTTIGWGMWGNRVLVGTGWNMYNWIAFADVNADGFPDVLARDDSGNLYAYPATRQTTIGWGMWGNRVLVGTGWNMYNTILVGDVNDDGYPDLLGRDNSGNLYGYPATRQSTIAWGMWGNRVLVGTGWNMYPQIALADIGKNNSRTTGNGPELIGEDPSGNLYAYPNNDFGTLDTSTFADRILVGTGWNMYITFLMGDLNQNGYTDMVGIDGNGNLEAYPNNQVSTVGWGIWGNRVLVGTGWNMYPIVD